jgi:chromate transporter
MGRRGEDLVTRAGEAPYSLARFLAYFARLGALGFGGPIALVGYMQRDLVDERRWIEQADYDEGLALAQLSPGPLAAQLAIYLGWVRARLRGAIFVSIAFVAPSFLMVIALSALYLKYGGLGWIQGAFYGIGASVIAIIARSAQRLAQKTLARDRLLWVVAAVNAAVTAITQAEIVWLVVLGGLAVLAMRARPAVGALGALPLPAAFVSGLKGPAAAATLAKIFTYFATAGLFVFGSGLAIVPFLHGGVVIDNAWLTERQFLDAVAVAMITPGPVVITVAFIGYLVAGPAGAVLSAIGVFFPCLVIVLVAAPRYRRVVANAKVKAFVAGVTAGAVGAIAGAAIVLARRALIDWPTVLIGATTLAALVAKKGISEPVLILIAGIVGIAIRSVVS